MSDNNPATRRPALQPGDDPRLPALLDELPLHGIDVLPDDYRRIALVLPLGRTMNWRDARELLVALLAKDAGQRRLLRHLYERHLPRPSPLPDQEPNQAPDQQPDQQPDSPAKQATPGSQPRRLTPHTDSRRDGLHAHPRRRPILALTIALLVILSLTTGWFAWQYLQPAPAITPPGQSTTLPPRPPPLPGELPPRPPPLPGELPSDPIASFHSWAPVIEAADPLPALGQWLPAVALMLAALAAAGWLGQRLWKRRHPYFDPVSIDPKPDTPPGWAAGDRNPPPLLDSARRREMIWGVQRFESERPLTRLDIPATVSASARQGTPELHFARARYQREVWLWLDVRQQTPEARQLWQQTNTDLERAGLATRPARFADLPDPIYLSVGTDQCAAHGTPTADLESAARQALVAIFTDGEGLATLLADPDQADRPRQLARELARWPRLCLVDFSNAGLDLGALGGELGLTVIQPRQLPLWLAERPLAANPAASSTEPVTALGLADRQWAALCALPGLPITLHQARELRAELDLPATWPPPLPPGWSQQADGITLSPAHRRELLNDLARQLYRQAGPHDPSALSTQLDLALSFWRQRLRSAAATLPAAGADGPARDRHQLDIEQALLDLWQPARVADATRRLYARWKLRPLRADITRRLRELAPGPPPSAPPTATAPITLPWSWRDLPKQATETATARLLLTKMGLGQPLANKPSTGKHDAIRARPAAEALLLLGLCLGLAGAAGLDIADRLRSLSRIDILHDQPIYASPLFRAQVSQTRRNGRLYAASRKLATSAALSDTADVILHWCWTGLPADQLPDYCKPLYRDGDPRHNLIEMGDSLLLRAGTLAEPIRACADPAKSDTSPDASPWPALSVAVIAADTWRGDSPAARDARRLAIELLDNGGADLALIGPDGYQQARELNRTWAFIDDAQWLFFSAKDTSTPPQLGRHRAQITAAPGPLARWLDRKLHGALAVTDLPAAQGRVKVLAGQPRLWGGPRKRSIRLANDTDMTLIELCPGSYTRGSASDDPQNYSREQPAHPLLMPGFEIAATETSRAQARALLRGAPPPPDRLTGTEARNDQLPATSMSWPLMARACARLPAGPVQTGGKPDLPSQAQWEYAARAGSQTPWSWGDQPEDAASHAWFDGNSNGDLHPVAGLLPNPAGLRDMHGNAWEWTLDCWDYSPYEGLGPEAVASPPVETACTQSGRMRVLRGGAFDYSPWLLRSAVRFKLNPGYPYSDIGFRCVRGSARSSID